MSQNLISLGEAASLLGKNIRTIQRYIKTGTLKCYQRNSKNYVNRKELETKFNIATTLKEDVVEIKEEIEKSPKINDNTTFWQKEAREFQNKWTQEIKNHAQTREHLGEWKGRAEAYQSFASKLLTDGSSGNKNDIKNNHISNDPDISVDMSSKPRAKKTIDPNIVYYFIGVMVIVFIITFIVSSQI